MASDVRLGVLRGRVRSHAIRAAAVRVRSCRWSLRGDRWVCVPRRALPDDEWANGKCGFKALQYLALERPAVVSPVGVNTTIINDGMNGFLCATPEEWETALKKLIQDPQLRKSMGQRGRKTVQEHYSVASNSASFLSLFA